MKTKNKKSDTLACISAYTILSIPMLSESCFLLLGFSLSFAVVTAVLSAVIRDK